MNLRISTAGAVAALAALALAPAAHAKNVFVDDVFVCNTASQNWQGGDLVALDEDPQTAMNYASGMRAKSHGNTNAAMHSPALSLCGADPGNTGVNT